MQVRVRLLLMVNALPNHPLQRSPVVSLPRPNPRPPPTPESRCHGGRPESYLAPDAPVFSAPSLSPCGLRLDLDSAAACPLSCARASGMSGDGSVCSAASGGGACVSDPADPAGGVPR